MVYEKELENLLKSLEELENVIDTSYSFHFLILRFKREVKAFKDRLAFIEARAVI